MVKWPREPTSSWNSARALRLFTQPCFTAWLLRSLQAASWRARTRASWPGRGPLALAARARARAGTVTIARTPHACACRSRAGCSGTCASRCNGWWHAGLLVVALTKYACLDVRWLAPSPGSFVAATDANGGAPPTPTQPPTQRRICVACVQYHHPPAPSLTLAGATFAGAGVTTMDKGKPTQPDFAAGGAPPPGATQHLHALSSPA